VPIVLAGIKKVMAQKVGGLLEHFGYQVHFCALRDIAETLEKVHAPILLLAPDSAGEKAFAAMKRLRDSNIQPYCILLGDVDSEACQRKLLVAGAMDWVSFPLSSPRLLHACRKGMEWLHIKRIQQEYQTHLNDLMDRRVIMEMEAA
jgi:DNA-binding response OmpR family regulator